MGQSGILFGRSRGLIGAPGAADGFCSTVHEIFSDQPRHLEVNPRIKFQPQSDRDEGRQSPTHLFRHFAHTRSDGKPAAGSDRSNWRWC